MCCYRTIKPRTVWAARGYAVSSWLIGCFCFVLNRNKKGNLVLSSVNQTLMETLFTLSHIQWWSWRFLHPRSCPQLVAPRLGSNCGDIIASLQLVPESGAYPLWAMEASTAWNGTDQRPGAALCWSEWCPPTPWLRGGGTTLVDVKQLPVAAPCHSRRCSPIPRLRGGKAALGNAQQLPGSLLGSGEGGRGKRHPSGRCVSHRCPFKPSTA